MDGRVPYVARRGERRRWIRRLGISILATLLGVPALAATYQAWAEARDLRRYHPPGVQVDVGGFRLHLHTMGDSHAGPTVILEAGGGSFSAQWGWIHPAVAEFARVVAYDRPGLGWSERAPRPLAGEQIAEYLHTALQRTGIAGPYVHVGHSVGSPLGRAFAKRYPDAVAAMVMVDPRHLRTEAVLGERAAKEGEAMKRWLPILARFGIPRLLNEAATLADGLPPRQKEEGIAIFSATQHLTAMASEWDMGNRTTDALEAAGEDYGDMPVIILSSGQPDAAFDTASRARFTAAQASMMRFSTRAEHRMVEGADHYTIVTRREYAQVVVDAIREVVTTAREEATR